MLLLMIICGEDGFLEHFQQRGCVERKGKKRNEREKATDEVRWTVKCWSRSYTWDSWIFGFWPNLNEMNFSSIFDDLQGSGSRYCTRTKFKELKHLPNGTKILGKNYKQHPPQLFEIANYLLRNLNLNETSHTCS